MVTDVTSENYEEEVVNSEKPVVIDMWASWCGPCRAIAPTFKELADEMQDVKFVKIDVDSNSDLAQKFGVSSIPAFVVLKKGDVVSFSVGAQSKANMKTFIEKALV